MEIVETEEAKRGKGNWIRGWVALKERMAAIPLWNRAAKSLATALPVLVTIMTNSTGSNNNL